MDRLRDRVDVMEMRPYGDGRVSRPSNNATTLVSACVSDYAARQQYEAEVNALQEQLDQAGKLAEMYREQCIQAEDELSRVREETDVHKYVAVFVVASLKTDEVSKTYFKQCFVIQFLVTQCYLQNVGTNSPVSNGVCLLDANSSN